MKPMQSSTCRQESRLSKEGIKKVVGAEKEKVEREILSAFEDLSPEQQKIMLQKMQDLALTREKQAQAKKNKEAAEKSKEDILQSISLYSSKGISLEKEVAAQTLAQLSELVHFSQDLLKGTTPYIIRTFLKKVSDAGFSDLLRPYGELVSRIKNAINNMNYATQTHINKEIQHTVVVDSRHISAQVN